MFVRLHIQGFELRVLVYRVVLVLPVTCPSFWYSVCRRRRQNHDGHQGVFAWRHEGRRELLFLEWDRPSSMDGWCHFLRKTRSGRYVLGHVGSWHVRPKALEFWSCTTLPAMPPQAHVFIRRYGSPISHGIRLKCGTQKAAGFGISADARWDFQQPGASLMQVPWTRLSQRRPNPEYFTVMPKTELNRPKCIAQNSKIKTRC